MKNNIAWKLILVLILTGIFSEIFLRIIKPRGLNFYRLQKTVHRFDENYFVDLEPNVHTVISHFLGYYSMDFSTNNLGFRATRKIDPSIPQIGCIGDSVTMGFGVNDQETFCALLDQFSFQNQVYQSINLGVDAYGPAAISRKLERYIPQLNVKLLYYLPSGGDDIDDALFYKRKQNKLDYFIFKIQFLLTKHSYLFLGLKITQEQMKYRFLETFVFPFEKWKKHIACQDNQSTQKECHETLSYSFRDFLNEFTITPPPEKNAPPNFSLTECVDTPEPYDIPESMLADLERISQITQKHKIKLVYVLTPTDIETAWCSQRGKSHRYYAYLTSLAKILKTKKIPYINLIEFTNRMIDDKGRLNPRPYYITGDGHYTSSGNAWMAKILKEETPRYLK